MNIQTLNRMVKASYYAPNGAQLRKACYGLMAVNSRRASMNPAVALEQIEQLPKEEQAQVKMQIIEEILVASSEKVQASNPGLKYIAGVLKQNGVNPNNIGKAIEDLDPVLLEGAAKEVHSIKEAVQKATAIGKSRSFEETLSYFGNIPVEYLSKKFPNHDYLKFVGVLLHIALIIISFLPFIELGFNPGEMWDKATGEEILETLFASMKAYTTFLGAGLVFEYLCGSVSRWFIKFGAKVVGSVLNIPVRIFAFALKSFGWVLDKVTSGLKGAWNSVFNKQAKIAMQYPEFKRAYYSI